MASHDHLQDAEKIQCYRFEVEVEYIEHAGHNLFIDTSEKVSFWIPVEYLSKESEVLIFDMEKFDANSVSQYDELANTGTLTTVQYLGMEEVIHGVGNLHKRVLDSVDRNTIETGFCQHLANLAYKELGINIGFPVQRIAGGGG